MYIKFNSTQIVEVTNGKDQEFLAGRTYKVTPESAERWVRRKVAEIVDEKTARKGV